jgi:uncharacterized protein (TIGR02147 family)
LKIKIFDYLDYRDYLTDFVEEKRKSFSGFTLRYMANKLSVDSAHVSRILTKKRGLSTKLVPAFADLLGLKYAERRYFETLVLYNHSRKLLDKERFLKRLQQLMPVQSSRVDVRKYRFYSEWWHTAIRTLLAIRDFKIDQADQIAQTLVPSVRQNAVKESLELLLEFELVFEDENGYLKPTEKHLSTGDLWTSHMINQYQEKSMKLGSYALSKTPRELRDISTVTVGVGAKDLPKLKDVLKEYRNAIIQLATRNDDPDEVYQLNVQLFPLTRLQETDFGRKK